MNIHEALDNLDHRIGKVPVTDETRELAEIVHELLRLVRALASTIPAKNCGPRDA